MSTRKPSPHQHLGALIGQAHRQLRRAVDQQLEPFGLTEATWLPLLRLSRAKTPLRQKELAALLSLDGSSIVRVLDALQAAGHIERREEDGDRRAKSISLTDAGREVVARVEVVASGVRSKALKGLPAADIDATLRTLEHLCARLGQDDAP